MIYDTIKEFAKKRSVSIRQMETDLGFSNGTVNRWNGSATISLKKVQQVAEYLNVDPYTLLLDGIDFNKLKRKEEA